MSKSKKSVLRGKNKPKESQHQKVKTSKKWQKRV